MTASKYKRVSWILDTSSVRPTLGLNHFRTQHSLIYEPVSSKIMVWPQFSRVIISVQSLDIQNTLLSYGRYGNFWNFDVGHWVGHR